jgi:hypothetical protein
VSCNAGGISEGAGAGWLLGRRGMVGYFPFGPEKEGRRWAMAA